MRIVSCSRKWQEPLMDFKLIISCSTKCTLRAVTKPWARATYLFMTSSEWIYGTACTLLLNQYCIFFSPSSITCQHSISSTITSTYLISFDLQWDIFETNVVPNKLVFRQVVCIKIYTDLKVRCSNSCLHISPGPFLTCSNTCN